MADDRSASERKARLAQALRENMKRRKAQARARRAAAVDAPPAAEACPEGRVRDGEGDQGEEGDDGDEGDGSDGAPFANRGRAR